MTPFTRSILGFVLILSACGDDEEGRDGAPDAAMDSGGPDGQAKDAAADAAYDAGMDATVDAHIVPPDAALVDSGFCPSGYLPDGGPAYEQYMVTLTTAAESPVCPAAGAAAAGSARIMFSCLESSFYVTDLTWQNLSSTVSLAHIHYGAVGSSGPNVIDLTPVNTGGGNGIGNAMAYQAKAGAPATFDAFMNELRAGKAYINVHTQDCPMGEIRGQIPPH